MEETLLKNPPVFESRGFSWGAWNGALAIVERIDDRFGADVSTPTRLYAVRFATVNGLFPVPSMETDLGMPVDIARPDMPYTQTTFRLGRFGQRRFIPMGGFSELHMYRVPVSLRDMTDQEHRFLRRICSDRHMVEVSSGKKSVWLDLLSQTWLQVQAGPVEPANAAERLLTKRGVDTCDDVSASAAWEGIRERGVFHVSKNDRILWVI